MRARDCRKFDNTGPESGLTTSTLRLDISFPVPLLTSLHEAPTDFSFQHMRPANISPLPCVQCPLCPRRLQPVAPASGATLVLPSLTLDYMIAT